MVAPACFGITLPSSGSVYGTQLWTRYDIIIIFFTYMQGIYKYIPTDSTVYSVAPVSCFQSVPLSNVISHVNLLKLKTLLYVPPPALTFRNSVFCPLCIYVFYMCLRTNGDYFYLQHQLTETECFYCAVRTGSLCFVWIWEPTAIIYLYSINWLVFITDSVYCAVRTGYLCVLCGSENKQRLFPYTALTDWFL
jgi:hypothetical protein